MWRLLRRGFTPPAAQDPRVLTFAVDGSPLRKIRSPQLRAPTKNTDGKTPSDILCRLAHIRVARSFVTGNAIWIFCAHTSSCPGLKTAEGIDLRGCDLSERKISRSKLNRKKRTENVVLFFRRVFVTVARSIWGFVRRRWIAFLNCEHRQKIPTAKRRRIFYVGLPTYARRGLFGVGSSPMDSVPQLLRTDKMSRQKMPSQFVGLPSPRLRGLFY